MSFDLALYINKNSEFTVQELRNHAYGQFFAEFHPDFDFDNLPDLFQWKISSKLFDSEQAETFYQGNFEIYAISTESHPELFESIDVSSDEGFLLSCYEEGDLAAALIFSDYFVEKGGALVSCEDEDVIPDTKLFLRFLLEQMQENDSLPEEFEDWQ